MISRERVRSIGCVLGHAEKPPRSQSDPSRCGKLQPVIHLKNKSGTENSRKDGAIV
jgi:hypothetical protein